MIFILKPKKTYPALFLFLPQLLGTLKLEAGDASIFLEGGGSGMKPYDKNQLGGEIEL